VNSRLGWKKIFGAVIYEGFKLNTGHLNKPKVLFSSSSDSVYQPIFPRTSTCIGSVVSLLYLLPEGKLILFCTHLTQRNLDILGQRKTVSFIFQISLLINGISKFLETLHVHAFVNQNRGLFADRDKIKTEKGYSVLS